MKKIITAAAAALLSLGLAGAATAGSATAAQARRAPLSVQFWTANGNQEAIDWNNGAAGNMVIQGPAPGRVLTFSNDITFMGDPAGLMMTSGGNFIAANSNCTGVTIKSNSGSDGTVWADHRVSGTSNHWLVNRFCSDQGDRTVAYADNIASHQWKFCDVGPINVTCGTGKFWNLNTQQVG